MEMKSTKNIYSYVKSTKDFVRTLWKTRDEIHLSLIFRGDQSKLYTLQTRKTSLVMITDNTRSCFAHRFCDKDRRDTDNERPSR